MHYNNIKTRHEQNKKDQHSKILQTVTIGKEANVPLNGNN